LGIAYRNLGQYERAIDFHEQSLAIAREIGDQVGEAYALGNLGNAFANLGQDDRALEQFGQAIALFNELGARAEEALFLSNIGRLLNRQNQPELAIIFLKASVDVREAIRGDIRGLDTDLQQSFTDTVADDTASSPTSSSNKTAFSKPSVSSTCSKSKNSTTTCKESNAMPAPPAA